MSDYARDGKNYKPRRNNQLSNSSMIETKTYPKLIEGKKKMKSGANRDSNDKIITEVRYEKEQND